MFEDCSADSLGEARSIAAVTFKLRQSVIQQVIPHVMSKEILRSVGRGFSRDGDGAPRNLQFSDTCSFVDPLDLVAVTIARSEIHLRVRAGRFAPENRFHERDRFKELRPVERRERPHARDDIGDGNLTLSLSLMLEMNNVIDAL